MATSKGEPFVWLTGLMLAVTLGLIIIFFGIIAIYGFGTFWTRPVAHLTLESGKQVIGEIHERSQHTSTKEPQVKLKVGNRDLYGLDFRWVPEKDIQTVAYPVEVAVWERMEYGNFYGILVDLSFPKTTEVSGELTTQFEQLQQHVAKLLQQAESIEEEITDHTYAWQSLVGEQKKLRHQGVSESRADFQQLVLQQRDKTRTIEDLLKQQKQLTSEAHRYQAIVQDASGRQTTLSLPDIVHVFYPNQMGFLDKLEQYFSRWWQFLSEDPREANTEGGVFPAIFGTVLMVLMMSIFSFPLGVLAAVYLREYAKEGWFTRLIRIAVNNLAGIPSIVYGVFGLGFFIYSIGGSLDQLFFAENLPSPTFGTGGILWASLTLGLLTVPVVIIATEEALASVPRSMREASCALGATPLQTLVRVVLPMASPGIMTGFILAMARAAGEVAPLMLTGVVKLAPTLAMDGQFPYLHLDRKFMHLGFHIYDVGFQSPNVEAAKPMVFVTTLLLIAIVCVLTSVAMALRFYMKQRYTLKAF